MASRKTGTSKPPISAVSSQEEVPKDGIFRVREVRELMEKLPPEAEIVYFRAEYYLPGYEHYGVTADMIFDRDANEERDTESED